MAMARIASFRALRLLCLALLLSWGQPGRAQAASTEVVISPDQARTTVDRGMLRAIFTTRLRQWPDGTPIRIFIMPDDSALHDQFCREQLGMYPYVLRELWDRLLYTGTGLTPTVVRSESEMRARVQATPGAIGYLPANPAHSAAGDFRAIATATGDHAVAKDHL
jgi:ABC-type phosphate transport system substrate-binding protein